MDNIKRMILSDMLDNVNGGTWVPFIDRGQGSSGMDYIKEPEQIEEYIRFVNGKLYETEIASIELVSVDDLDTTEEKEVYNEAVEAVKTDVTGFVKVTYTDGGDNPFRMYLIINNLNERL